MLTSVLTVKLMKLSLKFDILNLLAEGEFRPSEIRERLHGKYKKYDSDRSFDVIICRELSKLRDFINRKDKGHQLVYYSLNRRGVEELKRIKNHKLIDSTDPKWWTPFHNFLIRMKHEDTPDEFFQFNCISFIGNIPCTFKRSVEGMQRHLAWEEDLQRRHWNELEPLKEKYFQIRQKYGRGSKESLDFFERIREEVGWTVGEYFEKLLEKAKKEKGIYKIMTILGITEEMLEEMYRQKPRI